MTSRRNCKPTANNPSPKSVEIPASGSTLTFLTPGVWTIMENTILKTKLTRIWWVPLFTGLLAVVLGVWSLFSPMQSLTAFAYAFACCLSLAGLFNCIYAGFNSRAHSGWGWSLALGLLEIVSGVWMFCLPEAVLVQTFVYIIGIWLLVAAINSICEACLFAGYNAFWMLLMIVMLVAAVIFAVIFLSNPVMTGVAVWVWLGLSLILFGIYRLTFAFHIRKMIRQKAE